MQEWAPNSKDPALPFVAFFFVQYVLLSKGKTHVKDAAFFGWIIGEVACEPALHSWLIQNTEYSDLETPVSGTVLLQRREVEQCTSS